MDKIYNDIKQRLVNKERIKDIYASYINSGYAKSDIISRLILFFGVRLLIILILLFVLIFLLLLVIGYFYDLPDKSYVEEMKEQESNTDFIFDYEDNLLGNVKVVDVSKITRGDSHIQGISQYYYLSELKDTTVFQLNGYFEGIAFQKEYYGDENILKMRVAYDMKPDDGVVEGFIVERINDYLSNNISAFIFLDSDWKNKFPNTKIFWGSNYQYYMDFKFIQVDDGIYMTEIYDDPNRHFDNFSVSVGGIAVGDLDVDNILSGDITNKTFIRLYS